MSLRAFHIFFIVSVVLLFMFLCYWNYMNWYSIGGNNSLSYMLISLGSAILTIFYGIKFYSKTKILND
mgnify:CR=1 FL=1